MPMIHPAAPERVALLHELLYTSHGLYHWLYDDKGTCLQTNSPGSALDAFFSAGTGGKQEMLLRGAAGEKPVLLGLPLGLVWAAAFEHRADGLYRCHVLGPALHTAITQRDIQQALETYHIPVSWQQEFADILHSLPVLSVAELTRTAVMLHSALTGEALAMADVLPLVAAEPADRDSPGAEVLHIHRAEQKLLDNVRKGHLDYQPALAQARALAPEGLLDAGDPAPLRAALQVFCVLCVRAAIEGGVSPEMAYASGEKFATRLAGCSQPTQLESTGEAMYRDFIQRVYDTRQRTDLSRPIRSCCDYILLHTEEALTLEHLARRVGYTVNYLSRKFTQEVGMPPSDYIKKARIDRACLLLITTDLPVPEIAAQLRFCNRGYFSAVFKGQMGMTPVEYRQRYQIK